MIEVAENYPGTLTDYKVVDNVLEVASDNHVLLRIEPITDEIIRVRYSTVGYFDKDFSYAIDPNLDRTKPAITIIEKDKFLEIRTEAVSCLIERESLRLSFYDSNGQIINRDEKGFHWEHQHGTANKLVKMSKSVMPGESFYGMGDKPTELNLREKRFENWGTDSYGYDKDWDPLYKNIPFYYGLHRGMGYGIFFDNSFRTFFDFAKERPDATSFWVHGGEMNYYFIAGPDLMDVARRYSTLTGRPDMPAMWSLGFQQCKWSYYPESVVREVCSTMRKHEIPCDAIYLDIDYMDGFRCFTWNTERFPEPKKMVEELAYDGFKTMVIIDPGLKIDKEYAVFKEALDNDYFCRHENGAIVEGIVWPGNCHFPDFTREDVRKWWADLYQGLIEDIGIAGIWNDMNEPALFEVDSKTFPERVRHDYDGNPCSHLKAHNVYGMQMARATYEGVKKYGNNKRGLVITRSGYSGLQRYTSVWTGDNCASWQHIWLANVQCQRLAISGVSFSGSDIGGFVGHPTPEMFVRWIQLGIFHTFCRVHSSQDDGDQEPWSFGPEALKLFRDAINLRYRMLPYHYTAFYQNHKYGTPVIRPLVFVDQDDINTHYRDAEFLCGDHVLTASISTPGQSQMEVYLPRGTWYQYWTKELINGQGVYSMELTPDTFPFFVRAGAVIPMYPVQQYVDELHFDEITLDVYFKEGQEQSMFYEDAHNGYQYENGDIRFASFELRGLTNELTVTQDIEGHFVPGYQRYRLNLIGIPFEINQVVIDGNEIDKWDGTVSIDFKKIEVRS